LNAQDRSDPVGAIRRSGAADAMTVEGARILFGKADVERQEGAGAIMTYRTTDCAMTLVFAADNAGDLRLSAAQAVARDQRAAIPPLDKCVRQAIGRRGAS